MLGLGDLFDADGEFEQEAEKKKKYEKNPLLSKNSYYYEGSNETGFVGLMNQGATCYLNSLIQCLYMTPEFRDELHEISLEELDFEEDETKDYNFYTNNQEPDIESGLQSCSNQNTNTNQVDFEALQTLIGMGFEEKLSREALQSNNGNIEDAANWLLTGGDDDYADMPGLVSIFSDVDSNGIDDAQSGATEMDTYMDSWKPKAASNEQYAHGLFSTDYHDNFINDRENTDTESLLQYVPQNEKTETEEPQWTYSQYRQIPDNEEGEMTDLNFDLTQNEEDYEDTCISMTDFEGNNNGTETQTSGSISELLNDKECKPLVPKRRPRRIPIELKRLFAQLQRSSQRSVSTQKLTDSFGWDQGNEAFQQHDVQELNRLLFEAIEAELVKTSGENLIKNTYRGTILNQIICSKCNSVSSREEDYQDLSVLVKGINSLPKSLNNFVSYETLDESNQYFCEKCQEKVDALKGVTIRSFPKILIFSLNRFEYNFEEEKREKIATKFEFPEILDMFPYSEEFALQNSGSSNLYNFILNQQKELLNQDIENNEEEIENSKKSKKPKLMESVFDPNSKRLYKLMAVISHCGGAYGGHYHCFIQDLFNTKLWFDFNDSTVTAIEMSQLASQYQGNSECAYMLIYRESNLEENLNIHDIPEEFSKEISIENERFEKEKIDYETAANEIRITIHDSSSFDVLASHLIRKILISLNSKKGPFGLLENTQMISLSKFSKLRELKQRISNEINNFTQFNVIQIQNKLTTLEPEFTEDSDEKTLEELGFEDEDDILVWNGTTIENKFYPSTGPKIDVNVRYMKTLTDIEEISFEVEEKCFLSEFRHVLGFKTDITFVDLYIAKVVEDTNSVVQLVDDYSTLSDLGITSTTTLYCEQNVWNMQSTLTEQYLKTELITENEIRITVTNLCSFSPTTFMIICEKDESLFLLKQKILLHLNENSYSVKETECKIQNSMGTIFNEEDANCFNIFVQQDEYQSLEAANILKEPKITLIEVESKESFQDFHSIEDFMGQNNEDSNGLHSNLFHIRCQLSLRDSVMELDFEKTTTIKEAKIEFANLAKKDVDYCRLRKTDIFDMPEDLLDDETMTLEDANIMDNSLWCLEDGKPPVLGEINLRCYLYVPADDTFSTFLYGQHFDTEKLLDLDISKFIKLKELKEELSKQHSLSGIVSSGKNLRLYDDQQNLLRKDQQTLKSLNFEDKQAIYIQVLHREEELKGNTLVLYLHKRLIEDKSFDTCIEILFEGNSVNELKEKISKEIDISADNFQIAKYVGNLSKWGQIVDTDKNNENNNVTDNESEKNQQKKQKKSNVRGFPYHLKDFDILAYKDLREDPDNLDICFHLDVQFSQPKSKKPKNSQKNAAQIRAPEAVLKIKTHEY